MAILLFSVTLILLRFQVSGKPGAVHIIDRLWIRFGHLSWRSVSAQLREDGTPWSRTYFEAGAGAVIGHSLMREHVTRLALAGRQATPDLEPESSLG